MKIGLIIHSHTGNTLFVAEKIKETLVDKGHSAVIERVCAVNEDPSAKGAVQLKNAPNTIGYDALIFGAPVRGYSLSPVMRAYLKQLPSLKEKIVGCFVTQHFPKPWMGGSRAIKQMKALCESKEGALYDTGIINWSSKNRDSLIAQVQDKMQMGLPS